MLGAGQTKKYCNTNGLCFLHSGILSDCESSIDARSRQVNDLFQEETPTTFFQYINVSVVAAEDRPSCFNTLGGGVNMAGGGNRRVLVHRLVLLPPYYPILAEK